MRFLLGIAPLILVWFSVSTTNAQTYSRTDKFEGDDVAFGKNNISISLFPIINHGFEVSYDRCLSKKHWLKLQPMYYRQQDYTQSLPTDMKIVQGLGFKLHHKYFPIKNYNTKIGLFLDYGPMFQQFQLTNKSGDEVFFDKIGAECVFGVQKVIANVFFCEFYAGIAGNYLRPKNPEDGRNKEWLDILGEHSQTWFDYGKTGNYLLLGFNVGILF